jgi:hypothetical protein
MSQAYQYSVFLVCACHIQAAYALRPVSVEGLVPEYNWQEWIEYWNMSMDLQKRGMDLNTNGLVKDGSHNLCINGHLAPELFLIGAQKSATSSLAAMTVHPSLVFPRVLPGEPTLAPHTGGSILPEGYGTIWTKELHTFDNKDNFAKGKDYWLSHYPECTTDERLVATDMTPNYLMEQKTPNNMKQFYGDQLGRIKLVSVLRNPVNRIQSAFHFFRAHSLGSNRCRTWFQKLRTRNQKLHGFKSYVQGIISGHDPCRFVAHSKYHDQIKLFLDVVNASQFIGTFPMREVVAPADGIFRGNVAVLEAVGLSASPVPPIHTNSVAHPALEDDVGDAILLERFHSYVGKEVNAEKVAQLHIDNNITIFGYTGPQDVRALADFLDSRW